MNQSLTCCFIIWDNTCYHEQDTAETQVLVYEHLIILESQLQNARSLTLQIHHFVTGGNGASDSGRI